MNPVDVTFGRACKIWWSYTWRALVLSLLVAIPLEGLMGFFMINHLHRTGNVPDPTIRARLMLAWPFVMAITIALQAQGMRWMLRKAAWSDFRVAVLPREQ
jgi:hypothetical protein